MSARMNKLILAGSFLFAGVNMALAADTSLQWGADRTATPWNICAYDSTNTCITVFTLPASGGTGVNNGTSTLTLLGGYTLSFTMTGNTALTLPTSGTITVLGNTAT